VLTDGNIGGILDYLLTEESTVVLNPYATDLRNAVKTGIGATLTVARKDGSVDSGLITFAGAYDGKKEADEFVLHKQTPGIIGPWHSTDRGGYDVLCIAAHEPGKEGYVAVWEVKTSKGIMGMGDISKEFGVNALDGTNILENDAVQLFTQDPSTTVRMGGYKVRSEGKAKGSNFAYKLK